MKATEKIITRNSQGEVKAINEVDSDIVESTKVQSIIVKVDDGQLELCLAHYDNRFESREDDLQELFDFGILFQSAKKSVNNNNKAFGKWREATFPELTVKFVSYSINLIVHKTEIETWIKLTDSEVTNREYRNPYSVYVAFNRYKKRIADKLLKEMAEEFDTPVNDDDDDTPANDDDTPANDDDTPAKEIEVQDAEVKTGHKVVNNIITVEEKIEHYHLIVNQIIPLLNSEKLSDKEIEGIKVAHNSLHLKLKELNII